MSPKNIIEHIDRASIVKELFPILTKHPRMACAFDSAKILEYFIFLRNPELSLWTSMQSSWVKKFTNFNPVVKALAFPALFSLFLLAGIISALFAKNQEEFPVYAYDKFLFLARTPVHFSRLHWIIPGKNPKKVDTHISLWSRLGIVFCFFQHVFQDMRLITQESRDLTDTVIRDAFDNNNEILLLGYTLTYFKNRLLYFTLKTAASQQKAKTLCVFEGGHISHAVREIASQFSLQTLFAQHGILARGTELISGHDSFIVQLPIDQAYLEHVIAKKITCDFIYSSQNLRYTHPHKNMDDKKKVALFTLMDPTEIFSRADMLDLNTQFISSLLNHDWEIIVRTHPSDKSNWWGELVKQSPQIYHDPYSDVSLKESIMQNEALIVVSSFSMSIIDALQCNVLPMTIYHLPSELWSLFNFNDLSYTVKSKEDMDLFAAFDSKTIDSLLKDIYKRI